MKTHPVWPAQGTCFLNPRGSSLAFTVGVLCLCLWTGLGSASNLDFTPLATSEILLAQRAISDSEVVPTPVENPNAASLGTPPPVPERHKSAGRAFIYNVLLPGAGHLYAGNKRGWAHIGMEGVAWATYFYYHERGTAKEDEFEAHADEHWSKERWYASGNWEGTPADSLLAYFEKNNRQHYYEDILKLNTYAGGWDDPANRNFNRGMRNDSNNFLKNARYAVVGGFVNRIVSAVDVLRMLKRQKNALLGENTRIRIKVRTKPFSEYTAVGFEIRKQI